MSICELTEKALRAMLRGLSLGQWNALGSHSKQHSSGCIYVYRAAHLRSVHLIQVVSITINLRQKTVAI